MLTSSYRIPSMRDVRSGILGIPGGFLCPLSLPIGFKWGLSSGAGDIEWFDVGDRDGVREWPMNAESCDDPCDNSLLVNLSDGTPLRADIGDDETDVTTVLLSLRPGLSFQIIGLLCVATWERRLVKVECSVAVIESVTPVEDNAKLGSVWECRGLLLPIGCGSGLWA